MQNNVTMLSGGKKTGARTFAVAISLAGKRVSFRFPLTPIFLLSPLTFTFCMTWRKYFYLKLEENEHCALFLDFNINRSMFNAKQWCKSIAQKVRMDFVNGWQRPQHEKAQFRPFWIGFKTPEDSPNECYNKQWTDVFKNWQTFFGHWMR